MARRRVQTYRSTELSELTRQLLYAPPTKRAEVVRHAELLHDELDPTSNYPIDFIVYRLTGRRVPPRESVTLVGEAIRPDLRLMIDALSRSIELTPQAEDPGETTGELAARLGVSTKTIARWRDDGLRWRWGVREPGGKPVVLIPRAALSDFERRQQGRVASAGRFTRLDEVESYRLIARARRLADATDAVPQAILEHLARRTGRSVETIRQRIARHDAADPEARVFADRAGPLSLKQKRVIDRAYRRGVGVSLLCRRFRKTRSTIYRAIHEARAERVRAMAIHVVRSPMFDRDDADEVILRPISPVGRARRLDRRVIAGVPDELRGLFDQPIVPDPAVRSLIVRYNYLKHRAKQAQDALRAEQPRAVDLDRFDALWQRVSQTRGQIIGGMLPIVLSVVRRQIADDDAASHAALLAMLDQASAVLLEEIERFDPSLSHQFESVLTNRLLRVLAQASSKPSIEPRALMARLHAAGFEPQTS